MGVDSTCIDDYSETPKLPMRTTKRRERSQWRTATEIASEKAGDSRCAGISYPNIVRRHDTHRQDRVRCYEGGGGTASVMEEGCGMIVFHYPKIQKSTGVIPPTAQ